MSQRTTSPSCFKPASRASVPPIWPAPTSAILLRAIEDLFLGGVGRAESAERRGFSAISPLRQEDDGYNRLTRHRGDVFRALHLVQARRRALEFERAIAFDVELIRRHVGRHHDAAMRVVKRVDEGVEALGLIAARW